MKTIKKASLLFASLALVLGAGLVGNSDTKEVKAASETYTYTFISGIFSGNGTKELNGINWTLTNNGNHYGYDKDKGLQIGSGKNPAKTLSLSTSDFTNNIISVTVNTSGASSIKASISATIGGETIGSSQSISATATPYSFENTTSATGELVLSWTQTSSKAIYIKSIVVE